MRACVCARLCLCVRVCVCVCVQVHVWRVYVCMYVHELDILCIYRVCVHPVYS